MLKPLLTTLLFLGVITNTVIGQNDISKSETANPVFESLVWDFGKISPDSSVFYEYKFCNEGPGSLIFYYAKCSCGCCVASAPKDPFEPGECGSIPAKFNPSGKSGKQMKTISIGFNGVPGTIVLRIQGEIVPHEQPENK